MDPNYNPKTILQRSKSRKSWFSRYDGIPQEEYITDLDKINKSNFHKHMRSRLIIDPARRTEDDIDVLKHCTKYLSFFDNIIHEDPMDNLMAHTNGCKLLIYRKSQKGSSVTLYKDVAKEFYIILSGKIGIFIPKPDHMLQEELEAIDWIFNAARLNKGMDCREIHMQKIQSKLEKDHKFYKYLHRYKLISKIDDYIEYRPEYVKQVCGGLEIDDFEMEAKMFLKDKVNHFLGSEFNFLDGNHAFHVGKPAHYRLHVR